MLFGRTPFAFVPFSTVAEDQEQLLHQFSAVDQSDQLYLVRDLSESVIPDVPDIGTPL